jgi:predicted acetyltransferase
VTVDVRPVTRDELPAYMDAMSTGFLERPDVTRVAEEVAGLWDLQRTWAAFDGPRVAGTFRSWATEMTLPGGARLAAAAISGVTVLPTHRRRGILRQMVATEHAAIRERDEAISLLYASEYPIYGRFGYGPATDVAKWTLHTAGVAFRGDPAGSVELVPVDAATRDVMKGVHDAWRRMNPGDIRRRDAIWDFDLGLVETSWGTRWKGFAAFHRDGSGAVDGYVRYHAESKWEVRQPRNELIVDELIALTPDAYAALWRFLAEIDWVAVIRAENRTPTEPLRWLVSNARAAAVSDVGDGIWVRLVDAPRALETRGYEREGRLVLEIAERGADGDRRRLELDASPDGAQCRATDRSPDLTVPLAAVGAAYLGWTRLSDAVLGTGVDEHREGALGEADRLFRTAATPWCTTFF